MKQIEFTITPKGDVKIETSGFQGQQCTEAVKDIRDALFGGKEAKVEYKPEYWQAAPHLREPE